MESKAAQKKEDEYKQSLIHLMHKADRDDFKEARQIQRERSEAADRLKQKEAVESQAQVEANRDPEEELKKRRAAYEAEKHRREFFG